MGVRDQAQVSTHTCTQHFTDCAAPSVPLDFLVEVILWDTLLEKVCHLSCLVLTEGACALLTGGLCDYPEPLTRKNAWGR